MTVRAITTTRYIDEDSGIEYTHKPIEESVILSPIPSGFVLSYLVQDQDAQSPDEWKNLSLFLVHYHQDCWIPDERMTEDVLRSWYHREYGYELEEEEEETLNEIDREYWVFEVAAYIHSGVVLSLGSGSHFPDRQWDVSHVGAVFVAKEEWEDREKARKAAEGVIEGWNQYFTGDVYGIVHERLDADKVSVGEDSCWNFYGYDYAKAEMENAHKAWVERE